MFIFFFPSEFESFERYRFVSISKQFDIEALLSKNIYDHRHPYSRRSSAIRAFRKSPLALVSDS